MLVQLAMMFSTSSGWVLPSEDKACDLPLSPHDSAITGEEVDGGRARRQLASGCPGSWSASAPAEPFADDPQDSSGERASFRLAGSDIVSEPSVTAKAGPAWVLGCLVHLLRRLDTGERASRVSGRLHGCKPCAGARGMCGLSV